MIKELLTEKLRPKKFDHLILPARIKSGLSNGTIMQNVLLYGSPGTGKTSAAKVLATGSPTLYINVSDESSVEIIRTKITDFCSQMTVLEDYDENPLAPKQENGLPYKMIILDEFDGASDQFYKAFRATVDKFTQSCRFIATCNFINKVPEPVQSRFECINFDFVNKEEEKEVYDEWKIRIKSIFDKLGITVDNKSLELFIEKNFPDMRAALNKIQNLNIRQVKSLTMDQINEMSWDFSEVYDLVSKKPDPINNYEFIVGNYSSMVDDVMSSLGSNFVMWIKEKHPSKTQHIPKILIAVASHQAQRVHVINPMTSLLSLCFTLQNILNS